MGNVLRKSLFLTGMLVCWLALTGCPGLFNPFWFQHYFPLKEGNTWSFGCFIPPENDPLGKTPFILMLTDFSVTDCHPTWTFQLTNLLVQDTNSTSYWTLTLVDDVLYYAKVTPESEDNADEPVPLFHADLTPRTITDPNDPLVKAKDKPVRYEAGSLIDFIPLLPPYTDGNSVQQAITIDDFGPTIQNLTDCIALETNTAAEGEEPNWVANTVLARDIGPVYMIASALQEAIIRRK